MAIVPDDILTQFGIDAETDVESESASINKSPLWHKREIPSSTPATDESSNGVPQFPAVQKADTAGSASRYIWHNRKPFRLLVYPRELQILSNQMPRESQEMPRRKKDDITCFSKSSRLRMMRTMSRIHTKVLGKPIFITCTMRKDHMSNKEFQERFQKIFLPSLKEIVAGAACIWRLEPHKSGRPHYHLILWSFEKERKLISKFYGQQIRKSWRNTIRDHSEAAVKYSCRIAKIKNRQHLQHYVSKYCAKVDDEIGSGIKGRRWATSKSLPVGTISEINITREDYERLKNIVDNILTRKGMKEGLRKTILGGRSQFWLWVEESEIIEIMEKMAIPPPWSAISRYSETGNTLLSHDELALIASDFGYDY